MKRPSTRPSTTPSPRPSTGLSTRSSTAPSTGGSPATAGPASSRSGKRSPLGRRGEDAAADHLAARGYQIVARNVRVDRVELDLIVRRGDAVVFVEVKSRRGARHGEAAEAVDARKQRRLRHGAQAWLAGRPVEARGARRHRFDVVTCLLLEDVPPNETSAPEAARWSIEHWEAAF